MKLKLSYLIQASLILILILSLGSISENSHRQRCSHPSARDIAAIDSCTESFAIDSGTTSYEKFMSGKSELISEAKMISYMLPDHSYITIVNLAKVGAYSIEFLSARNYLKHRDLIYKQRIKKFKSENETSSFLKYKIDHDVRLRSFLVMNTAEPITNSPATEFIGGARVSVTRNAIDKLPFEMGLSIDRPQKDHSAAEIGALTANTKDNPFKSVEIINAAIKLAADYAKADDVYIHTSAVHARMYHRMNIDPTETLAIDNLNYVLRFEGKKWTGDQLPTRPAVH